jgi:hypothetical protein
MVLTASSSRTWSVEHGARNIATDKIDRVDLALSMASHHSLGCKLTTSRIVH